MRKYVGSYLKIAYCIAMMLVILASFSTATYAWFSANSLVATDRVNTRSGSDEVELLIDDKGGSSFAGSHESGIAQVNKKNFGKLMPVSTSNLKNFVYNSGTVSDMAVSFAKVEDERYYYHGKIYLMAKADNHSSKEKVKLYFDNASDNGGVFFKNAKGNVLNAARLGVAFEGGERHIFKTGDKSNDKKDQSVNTVINGVTLTANQVIDSSNGLKAVTDPSESLSTYTVAEDGSVGNGTKELLTMDLNKVYEVDVYFYIEGCDPDCTDVIQFNELDMHLAFYGVLVQEAK